MSDAETTLVEPAAGALPARKWVGRYLLLDELGRGGMGVVHKAYDASLQRHVAVKVLAGAGGRPERLEREGQVIAQLSHPNVVAVFDLGYERDQLFIAMEYVPGQTLAAWLETGHELAEILDVLVQAARGLAAGHARGVVHRDVKPSNVLVGDDGVVRVVDFGIARVARPDDTLPDRGDDAGSRTVASPGFAGARSAASATRRTVASPGFAGARSAASATRRTIEGSLIGTPGYMAPEQYLGGAITAATDQYSFCVVLYEALAGRSPFEPLDLEALRALEHAREVRPWPAGARPPAWLARIVERGLAAAPEARFASMDAVIAALTADRGRARRRVLLGAGVLGLAAIAAAATLAHDAPPDPCADAKRAVRLDDAAKVSTAFGDAVAQRLGAWRAMRIESCEATHVRHAQAAALFDRRAVCLDRRRAELDALVRAAAGADPAVALVALSKLPGLTGCADADALLEAVPLPDDPAARARIDAVYAELDDGFSLRYLARYDDAQPVADAALADARAAGYPPVIAEALALSASVGKPDDAVRGLWEMYAVGAAAKDDHAMADALIGLLETIGYPDDPRFPQAIALVPVVEGLAIRTGDDELIAKMWLNTGLVIDHAGTDEDDAVRRYQLALALKERLFGASSLDVAYVLNNLGGLASERGKYGDAIDALARAAEIKRAAFGDGHPKVVESDYNLGAVNEAAGRNADALAAYDRGLAGAKRMPTPDPELESLLDMGRSDVLVVLGRLDEALAASRAAAAVFPGASTVFSVGHVLHARGELPAAIEAYRKSLAMTEADLGADSTQAFNALYQLGKALCASGGAREGAAFATRAATVGVRVGSDAEASASFVKAGCLWSIGQLAPAVAAARRAHEIYASMEDRAEDLAEVDAWLAAHTP